MSNGENGDDLKLAEACGAGDEAALRRFDELHLQPLGAVLARYDRSPAFADEVRQLLREKLLVSAEGAPPQVLRYRGEGPLGRWVQVAAHRVALDLVRRRRSVSLDGNEALAEALAVAPDPAIQALRNQCRSDLKEALGEALRALPQADRVLLKLSALDGLGLETIGKSYGRSAATVCRELQRIRAELLKRMRAWLQARRKLTESDIDSLVRGVGSQFDMSLSGLMR